MATFEVKVYPLRIEEHPNADALELAVVGDYRSIVRKGQFKTGDLGVYIPEAAVLPEWLIEELGLVGKLAGKDKNRVKAIKLRGILSQGLVYPVKVYPTYNTIKYLTEDTSLMDESEIYAGEAWREFPVEVGTDCTEVLGITKYEPPIPTHMAGEVFNAHGYTLNYDIENIKKYPHVFDENELVLVTEKLHGTWTCFGYHPDLPDPIITSKGLSGRGLAFKLNEANENNLYVRLYREVGEKLLNALREQLVSGIGIYLIGEIYGKGVQDLHYGATKPQFRAFDIYVSWKGQGRYLSGSEFLRSCHLAGIETVPILGHGCFTRAEIDEMTNGKDLVAGENIREGVVIRPLLEERQHDEIGRVILKSVSEAYLLRGGEATEFN